MPLTGVQHTTAAASWDKLEGTNLSHPRSGFHEVKGVKKKKEREKRKLGQISCKRKHVHENLPWEQGPQRCLSLNTRVSLRSRLPLRVQKEKHPTGHISRAPPPTLHSEVPHHQLSLTPGSESVG